MHLLGPCNFRLRNQIPDIQKSLDAVNFVKSKQVNIMIKKCGCYFERGREIGRNRAGCFVCDLLYSAHE